MKIKSFIISLIVSATCMVQAQEKPDIDFYYYKGEKIFLDVDFSRISIVTVGQIASDVIKRSVNQPVKIERESKNSTITSIVTDDKSDISEQYLAEIVFAEPLTKDVYYGIIDQVEKESFVVKASPAYLSHGKETGVSNNINVKLKDQADINVLNELANKYSLKVLGYSRYAPLWYTLACTPASSLNAFEAAKLLYETKKFSASEPELLYHNLLASNDTYYSDQWGLKNTGQNSGTSGMDIKVENAWGITKGSSSIKVAIYDQGFEMNHPDLQTNVSNTGYDAQTNSTPSVVRGDHGTACAGITGAQQNNSLGISGVAPLTGIVSISLGLTWSNTATQIANGFYWAASNGIDVISNSWGGYNPSSTIDDALTYALTNGRSGKGMVVLFAAGNNDGAVSYPANSNAGISAVGAASPCGERKNHSSCDGERWGSNYGAELDVVAPGVLIPTTDRQGDYGYNYSGATGDYTNRDYTHWFNGTSSACPHVAGVAALMLSVNPNLTAAQVQNKIQSTAQKVRTDLYNYSTTSGYPNGTWNNQMGYGLVDAYNAVLSAVSCVSSYTNQLVTANTVVVGCSDLTVQNVTVSNNAKLTLDAPGSVIINGTFEVLTGSSLDVKQ
jgi:subtilisin family serine protease